MAFSRADRLWFFNPDHVHLAVGEIEWTRVNSSWRGRISTSAPRRTPRVRPEFWLVLRPRRIYEPTLAVDLGGSPLARVDVNGWHRFSDGVRSSTHLQVHDTGEAKTPETTELRGFPAVPSPYTAGYGAQMREVLAAAAPYLNLNISELGSAQPPFDPFLGRSQ